MTVVAGYIVLAIVVVLYVRWEWWQSDVARIRRAQMSAELQEPAARRQVER